MANKQQHKLHVNTFGKGMNKDLNYGNIDNSMYLHSENFRLSSDKGNSTGIIENVSGNRLIVNLDNYITYPEDYTLIGSTVNGNTVILFYFFESHLIEDDTSSHIYKAVIEDNNLKDNSFVELYNDRNSDTKLGFSPNSDITSILVKENNKIERLYFLDVKGYFPGLKSINISEAPDSLKDEEGNFIDSRYFDSNGSTENYTFSVNNDNEISPVLTDVGNGYFKSGMVQYAYRFLTDEGKMSSISPLTGLFHITESMESGSNTREYKGTHVDENSYKSFVFKIDINNTDIIDFYNSIRIYSIYYKSLASEPKINILNDIPISSSIVFSDIGSGYVGYLTLEELLVELNPMTSKVSNLEDASVLESKDNRLFLADIDSGNCEVDISNYDARTYRFNNSNGCKVYDTNGDYYEINNPDSYSLTLNSSPSDGGDPSPSGYYYENDIITIYANTERVFEFIEWVDSESTTISTTTPYDYTMPASDITLTANFSQLPCKIDASPTLVQCDNNYNEEYVTIDTNGYIYETLGPTWVGVVRTDNGIKLEIESYSEDARRDYVTIILKENDPYYSACSDVNDVDITVEQGNCNELVDITNSDQTFDNTSNEFILEIYTEKGNLNYDVDWSINITYDQADTGWINPNMMSGIGNILLTTSIESNGTGSYRSATLEVTGDQSVDGDQNSDTIFIEQNA